MIYDIAINILTPTSANYDTTTTCLADWVNQMVCKVLEMLANLVKFDIYEQLSDGLFLIQNRIEF